MAESPGSKPVRKRRKKAEVAQVNAADKPLDPRVWLLLGILLIVVAAFFYLDSASASGVDTRAGGSGIQIVFNLVYSFLGRDLAFIVFGVIGGLSLIWGLYTSFKHRSPSNSS